MEEMPGTTATEFSLIATTRDEPKAREALGKLLTGRPASVRDRVTLLIAELLAGGTEPLDRASEEVTITVASDPDALRVEVRDRRSGTVLRRLRRPASAPGRGWSPHLLSTVADRWGLVSDESGTWVWLEFQLPPERPS